MNWKLVELRALKNSSEVNVLALISVSTSAPLVGWSRSWYDHISGN